MPTATKCLYQGKVITAKKALQIKRNSRETKGWFQCIECEQIVNPHNGSTGKSPHIEHYDRNPDCSLSHPKSNRKNKLKYYSIDQIEAIEGYRVDLRLQQYKRSRGIAERRKKQDNYTCQACGFKLKHNGQFLAECHHLTMVSEGIAKVTIDDLVTLCPTCHRIAHTRSKPYSVEEIKNILKKAVSRT